MWLVWKLRLPEREARQPGPGCQGSLLSKREASSLSTTAGDSPRPLTYAGSAWPHLGIQQQEEQVLGRAVGPPLQHVGQEQELRGAGRVLSPGGAPPAREAPAPARPPALTFLAWSLSSR